MTKHSKPANSQQNDTVLGMGSGSILVVGILAFATVVGFLASRAGNPQSEVRQKRIRESNRVTAAALTMLGANGLAVLGFESGEVKLYTLTADAISSPTLSLIERQTALVPPSLHRSEIYTIALGNPAGGQGRTYMAATSRDGTTSIVEMMPNSYEPGALSTLGRNYVHGEHIDRWGLAFSPDNRMLAVGGYDPNIALLETGHGRPFYTDQAHTFWYDALAWAPDLSTFSRVAAGSAGAAGLNILYYQKDNEFWMKGLGHRGGIRSLAWSPDGRWLATGGDEDGAIRLWSDELERPAEMDPKYILAGYEVPLDGAEGAVTQIDWASNRVIFVAVAQPPMLLRLEKPKDNYLETDALRLIKIDEQAVVIADHPIDRAPLAIEALNETTLLCIDDAGVLHRINF